MDRRMAIKYRCATLQSKGRNDWTIPLRCRGEATKYTLGRDAGCSFVLSDMHISSKHVTITCKKPLDGSEFKMKSRPTFFEVQDSSSNGTWLNGKKLQRGQPVELEDGFEVSFPCDEHLVDDYTFIVNIPRIKAEDKLNQVIDDTFRMQWKNVSEKNNELIASIARLAASVYSMNDKMPNDVRDHSEPGKGFVETETVNEGALPVESLETTEEENSYQSQEIHQLSMFKQNTADILKLMVESMLATKNKILDSNSINKKEQEEIINCLELSKWEDVMECYNA